MSAVSDLVNGWPGGIIQASRHNVFVTPIYLVNQLYNEHRGDVRLSTTINTLDIDATASRRGNTIFIKAVNTNLTTSFATTVTLEGAGPATRAEIKTIAGRVASVESKSIPAARRFTAVLPKQSVSVITITVR
jgi:alpha-L-arabinofuranosidase